MKIGQKMLENTSNSVAWVSTLARTRSLAEEGKL